jgi:hypothetical protein
MYVFFKRHADLDARESRFFMLRLERHIQLLMVMSRWSFIPPSWQQRTPRQ